MVVSHRLRHCANDRCHP